MSQPDSNSEKQTRQSSASSEVQGDHCRQTCVSPTHCPSDQQIEDMLRGRLSPDEANALAELSDRCSKCESRFAALEKEIQSSRIADIATTQTCLSDESSESETLPIVAPGSRLGPYELFDEIGQGGMGVVYRARHELTKRLVAIKVIRSLNPTQQQMLRFESEAKAAQLEHRNIVRTYDVGRHNGQPYFAMQLIDGNTLSKRLINNTMNVQAAAEMVLSLTRAVIHAHSHGILHRDLKPSNVLIDKAGNPYLSDFGLAKAVGCDTELTQTGQAIGTPAYMPPEQAEGRIADIDERSDVYSIGAILYACFTGRPPHQGSSAIDTMQKVRDDEVVAPRHLNQDCKRDLETICLKCLEKDPDRRYQSAGALATDLELYLQGKPIIARPIGRFEKVVKWTRRHPAQAFAMCATSLAVVFMAMFTVSAWYSDQLTQSLSNEREAKRLAQKRESETVVALDQAVRANERAAQETLLSYRGLGRLCDSPRRPAYGYGSAFLARPRQHALGSSVPVANC